MLNQFRLSLLCLLVCACHTKEPPNGVDAGNLGKADDPTSTPPGLGSRPQNLTCVAPDRPGSDAEISHRRAFSNLSFVEPVQMKQAAQSSRWYVVEKRGAIWTFDDNEATASATVALDHRSAVDSTPNEAGLLGLAFHPNFAQNGVAFLSYNFSAGGRLFSRVTRIRSLDGGLTFAANTESEVLRLEQPFANHNGGNIEFGPDGLLYIAFGDGGSADDPLGNGQNTSTWLGSILRIDVGTSADYTIPSDNPFVSGGGLPEIYAYGLRNPWRFSFDSDDGTLWLADVGQNAVEEVDIIVNGGNYGWSRKEGTNCFNDPAPCSSGLIDPVAQYGQQNGDRSITGGHVYRGTALPSLAGHYIFGDFITGRVWHLIPNAAGTSFEREHLLNTGINLSSFAQDHAGEVYMLSYGDGTIRKIVPEPGSTSTFPTRLSDTGCFVPGNIGQVRAGVIPYEVNAPLWSDGAHKERYLAIPDGSSIGVAADGDFAFPAGSVLIKTFEVAGQRVETRLFVRHADGGWAGYAYKYNAAQTEAFLVSGRDTFTVGGQSWTIPSQADCTTCHTAAAGFALGPEVSQLNRNTLYPGANFAANQLITLRHIGVLPAGLASPEALPHLAEYTNSDASAEAKARSYLHANCSSCHRPGSTGRGPADLRFQTATDAMGICNANPESGDLGISGARLLVPGDPSKSILSRRMHTLGASRMPALGTSIVDTLGTQIVDDWIEGVSACSQVQSWSGLVESGVVTENEEDRFQTPPLPAGQYEFVLSGTGDADLYLRAGSAPTIDTFDCRPFLDGSAERCTVETAGASVLHLMVRGFAASSSYTLEGAPLP